MKKIAFIISVFVLSISCNNDDGDSSNCNINITNEEVVVGECTSLYTYDLTLDFDHENTTKDSFDVFVEGEKLFGTYNYADLPVTLNDFEITGHDVDFLYIWPTENKDCRERIQFEPPNCFVSDCYVNNIAISEIVCTSATTYDFTLDFDYDDEISDTFSVYDTEEDRFFGTYNLADLPVTINNYNKSENPNDYIQVCIDGSIACCNELTFESPDCE